MWVKVPEPVVFRMYKFRHLSLILHWLALFLAFMTSLAIVSDVISDAERKTLKTYLWHLQDTVSVRIKSLEKSNRHRALWCFWNSTFVRHRSHRTWSFEAREFLVLAQISNSLIDATFCVYDVTDDYEWRHKWPKVKMYLSFRRTQWLCHTLLGRGMYQLACLRYSQYTIEVVYKKFLKMKNLRVR